MLWMPWNFSKLRFEDSFFWALGLDGEVFKGQEVKFWGSERLFISAQRLTSAIQKPCYLVRSDYRFGLNCCSHVPGFSTFC